MKKRRRVLALLLAATLTFSSFSGIAMAKSETRPANGTTKEQPFWSGTGGSDKFRIPCLVSLNDGTVVAGCDARWTTYADGGGLDTIVSYSKDKGDNWNYTFANYLGCLFFMLGIYNRRKNGLKWAFVSIEFRKNTYFNCAFMPCFALESDLQN